MPDNSVDSIVTDPPYGLGFMGKKWDYDVPSVEIWAECLRVLKPGGHILAFAGTRTQHRMAVRIEDAGFEIRDMLAWVYGSGFPKSLDVSKAIDKAAGDDGRNADFQQDLSKRSDYGYKYTPTTDAAKQWQGWGTALKPALEPITLARKPLMGTVAENVLEHDTGGLNIEGCRVGTDDNLNGGANAASGIARNDGWGMQRTSRGEYVQPTGRWPANFIHDGSDEVVGLFPKTKTGDLTGQPRGENKIYGSAATTLGVPRHHKGDSGSAARFFYCAKASKRDRDEGLEGFEDKQAAGLPMRSSDGERGGEGMDGTKTDRLTVRKNIHPTVKPTDLMRYLCRLITPPKGVIFDPFMGSGSTGKAALLEGFSFIGCERDRTYMLIAEARIGHISDMPDWMR